MKKLHIILLEEPAKAGTPLDTLTVYVSRHDTINDARLTMHMQGILPKYKIVSHSVTPAFRTLLFMWFPSLQVITHTFGKLTPLTLLNYWMGRPLKKLFKGSTRKKWQDIGEYDVTTRRVYPLPNGERMSK